MPIPWPLWKYAMGCSFCNPLLGCHETGRCKLYPTVLDNADGPDVADVEGFRLEFFDEDEFAQMSNVHELILADSGQQFQLAKDSQER